MTEVILGAGGAPSTGLGMRWTPSGAKRSAAKSSDDFQNFSRNLLSSGKWESSNARLYKADKE